MKKIASYILMILMICMVFSGCKSNGKGKTTASESLDNLFTTVDLMDATITDLQTEMETGHVSSEQLTQMYIDRIEAYDEDLQLNSIIFINPNALEDARQLDEERKTGNVRGPLHGIPIIVKANIDVAGMPTTAGSSILANMVAEEDAPVVKRLKDAGAVILAQANMSEYAVASMSSRSTLGGNVHNAYDLSKTPAGSSGGSAVAVTSNFAAAGVGTDTGGSIRNPASFANLYGMRPSKGLVSASGIVPLYAYRDTAGPLARTAEDMALMLEVMAGTDEADDYTIEADADALKGDGYTAGLSADALKGMRIGYLEYSFSYSSISEEEYIFLIPDIKISDMYQKTMANLVKAGAELVDIQEYLTTDMLQEFTEGVKVETFEYDMNKYFNEKGDAAPYHTLKELVQTENFVMFSNLGSYVYEQDELADSFEETENPYTAKVGTYQRVPEWQKVLNGREEIAKIMEENDIDAIMYLNCFDVADNEDVIVEAKYNGAEYDIIFGPLLGLPEISLPMGFSETNEKYTSEMPLGLSVLAGYGQEATLLQIAYAYEQQAGDYIRRMPETTPALEDPRLNDFLNDLIDQAYSLDYSKYKKKVEGKAQLMLAACEKAKAVDKKDPYAVYEAAKELAEAYDNLKAAMGK